MNRAFQGLTFSNSYYFLPRTTGSVEQINKHMGSVNLTQIHITKKIIIIIIIKNHRNFDSLLSTRSVDEEVEWLKRLPENRYKMSYNFFLFSRKEWKVYRLKSGLLFYCNCQ